jgi:hypothetical protein
MAALLLASMLAFGAAQGGGDGGGGDDGDFHVDKCNPTTSCCTHRSDDSQSAFIILLPIIFIAAGAVAAFAPFWWKGRRGGECGCGLPPAVDVECVFADHGACLAVHGWYVQYQDIHRMPTFYMRPTEPGGDGSARWAGSGCDDVGQYRVTFTLRSQTVSVAKEYVAGTGDATQNKGHLVRVEMACVSGGAAGAHWRGRYDVKVNDSRGPWDVHVERCSEKDVVEAVPGQRKCSLCARELETQVCGMGAADARGLRWLKWALPASALLLVVYRHACAALLATLTLKAVPSAQYAWVAGNCFTVTVTTAAVMLLGGTTLAAAWYHRRLAQAVAAYCRPGDAVDDRGIKLWHSAVVAAQGDKAHRDPDGGAQCLAFLGLVVVGLLVGVSAHWAVSTHTHVTALSHGAGHNATAWGAAGSTWLHRSPCQGPCAAWSYVVETREGRCDSTQPVTTYVMSVCATAVCTRSMCCVVLCCVVFFSCNRARCILEGVAKVRGQCLPALHNASDSLLHVGVAGTLLWLALTATTAFSCRLLWTVLCRMRWRVPITEWWTTHR